MRKFSVYYVVCKLFWDGVIARRCIASTWQSKKNYKQIYALRFLDCRASLTLARNDVTYKLAHSVLYILLLICFSNSLCFAIDDIEYILTQQSGLPQIRWIKLTNKSPLWITGSTKFLAQDKPLIIQLDANSSLRIHSLNQDITPEMFKAELAKTYGAYLTVNLIPTNNARDLILQSLDEPIIIRLSLNENNNLEKLELNYFTARYEDPAKLVFYPNKVKPSGRGGKRILEVNGLLPKNVNFQEFFLLDINSKLEFNIAGPTNIEIASRYIYNESDISLNFPYKIHVNLNGQSAKVLTFLATPDYYNLYLDQLILSQLDKDQLFIPKGGHKISLQSDKALLIKLHSIENPGYLLPANYNPKPINEILNLQGGDIMNNTVPSDIKDKILQIQDNQTKGMGLSVSNLGKNLYKTRKSDSKLWNYSKEVENIFTFYRSLLPSDSFYNQLSIDYVVNYRLINSTDPKGLYNVKPEQIPLLLKQLPLGYFINLESNQKRTFNLPPLQADSEARIIIGNHGLKEMLTLYVQYDQNSPQEITIYPDQKYSKKRKPASALIGLAALENNVSDNKKLETLGGSFSQYNYIPAYLRSANIINLTLPVNTHKITIWHENFRENIDVAVQYKDSRKLDNTLIPQDNYNKIFINALRFFNSEYKLNQDYSKENFAKYLSAQNISFTTSTVEFYNNSLNLIRLLHERYLRFSQGFDDVDQIFIKQVNNKSKIPKATIDYANRLVKEKKWDLAVNAFSKIIEQGSIREWRVAHIERARALKMSGESYLAERSLKALILKSKDLQVKVDAYKQLMNLYQERKYYYGIEGLIAVYFIELGDAKEEFKKLADILIQDDNPKDAAAVQAMLDFGDVRPLLTNDEKILQAHQQLGIKIKDKLQSKSTVTRQEGFLEWLDWYYNHPGPKYYADATYLITSFYKTKMLYSNSRDKYENVFIADKNAPITMEAIGPANLKLIIKPLFDSIPAGPLKDFFVTIKINDKPYLVKVNNNITANPFKVVGKPNLKLGLEQIFLHNLDYGIYDIKVESSSAQVIVQPMLERPIVPLPVLPMLTIKTAEFIQNSFGQKKSHPSDYTVSYKMNGIKHSANLVNVDYQATDIKKWKEGVNTSLSSFINNFSVDKNISVINLITKTLSEYNITNSKFLLVKGSKLCDENKGNYPIDQLCNGFEAKSRLRPILTLDDNTEVIIKESYKKWEPESINLDIRQDLITGDDENSYVLSGNSTSIIDFTNAAPVKIKLKAAALKLIADTAAQITLAYQIDEGEVNKIFLDSKGKGQNIEFTIDQGKHSLRIFLIEPSVETFVKFELTEATNNQNWQNINIKRKTKYFVATYDKPVKLTVSAPAFIIAHKFIDEDNVEVKNFYITQGKQTIVLGANKDSSAFYRIYEKIPANPKLANAKQPENIEFAQLPEALFSVNATQDKKLLNLRDDLSLESQEGGTYSILGGFAAQISEDTMNYTKGAEKTIRYAKQQLSYRYFDEINRLYFYQDLLIKELKRGKPSLNFTTRLDYLPVSMPFNIFGKLDINTQHFSGRQNYALGKELGIRSEIYTSRKLSHIPQFTIFDRSLNYANDKILKKTNPESIDPEVYSNYARTHKRWINFSYKASYQPYLDNSLWSQVFWQSNKKFTHSDYIKYAFGFDQLIDLTVVGVEFSSKYYFKVDNRKSSFNRNQIGGYASLDYWLNSSNHRLELSAKLVKIFDSNISTNGAIKHKKLRSYSGGVGITLHFGNGRGYRDFRSDEIKFRQLKLRKIPSQNELNE